MTVTIQTDDFDIAAELAILTSGRDDIGAVASFVGKVRAASPRGKLRAMTVEHYPGMTDAELVRIEREAIDRFKLSASRVMHRVGTLRPGDNIVLVIACAPHRQDAFDACAFLMDYLKTRAPFWKKETTVDGIETWVDARETDDTAASRWH